MMAPVIDNKLPQYLSWKSYHKTIKAMITHRFWYITIDFPQYLLENQD